MTLCSHTSYLMAPAIFFHITAAVNMARLVVLSFGPSSGPCRWFLLRFQSKINPTKSYGKLTFLTWPQYKAWNLSPSVRMLFAYLENCSSDLLPPRQVFCWAPNEVQWFRVRFKLKVERVWISGETWSTRLFYSSARTGSEILSFCQRYYASRARIQNGY